MPVIPALAIAGLAASVIGTGVAAMGSIQAGQSAQSAANYQAGVAQMNARVAGENAQYAKAAGDQQATRQNFENAQRSGMIRAAMASSGLDVNTGSSSSVQQSQDVLGKYSTGVIRNQAARQAYGYETQATGFQAQSEIDRAQGQQSATAGNIGAFSSILGGASSLTRSGLQYQQQGLLTL